MQLSRGDFAWALAVAVLATCYLLSFHPFSRPVVLDPATWDYMSLALHDGLVPYRDIFLHKTPGAMFIGAAGGAAANGLGVARLHGVHAIFLAFGACSAALTFLLCRRHAINRFNAFAAALWLLCIDQWSLATIEGVRPKVATTTLGLASLLVSARSPVLGGVLGGTAALCWQPGLVFALGAVVELFRRESTPLQRCKTIGAYCVGAALPFGALLVYLTAKGALRPFFDQAFLFNLHYIDIHARTPADTVRRLWTLVRQWNAGEVTLLPLAAVGLFVTRSRPPLGLTVATAAYAALLFVSIQAWPDTILLAPGVAVLLAQGLGGLLGRGKWPGIAATSAATALAFANLAMPGSARFFPPITWVQQRDFMHTLAADLSPSDNVYVVSCPEFLIQTGRHSVLPWPYMWFGVDQFAASHTEGGFDGILHKLESADPKLMIVCRRWGGDLRQRFEEWAQDRYAKERLRFYPHTKKPMAVYRRFGAGKRTDALVRTRP